MIYEMKKNKTPQYNRTGQGCQCNQAIAVVGAGGGAGGVNRVFRTWNWPHMPVRIFTYRTGGDAAAGVYMQEMACTNKGNILQFFLIEKSINLMCISTNKLPP